MAGGHSDAWDRKVGLVFDTRPRVALVENRLWMKRKEEQLLRSAVVSPGVHVCLYGPSGSGKTSLAKSIVARLSPRSGAHFIFTRVNNSSSWDSFKSQIIENKQTPSANDPFDWKIGVKSLLPYFELSGSTQSGFFENAISRADLVERVDIRHLSDYLIQSNTCLVIDDVHFANDELLTMLTSLAKEITDRSTSDNSKIVFVGADDIFLRIMQSNDNLRDRTEEVSLGSIRDYDRKGSAIRNDVVWEFLSNGISELGLTDPRHDKIITDAQRKDCMRWIDLAADGLPKSIVKLGRRIAERGERRTRISYSDIVDTSKIMIRENFMYYRSRYRILFNLIKSDAIVQEVCLWMFKKGASKIHTLDDISNDLYATASFHMIEEAIKFLVDANFTVVTGSKSNVFFAKDPLLAHTIGVAISDPDALDIQREYFLTDKNAQQFLLRFTGEKEPELKTKV